ncbi:hypothetical protein ACIBF5_27100 [Micromonospora sp. NPDC050417]|uniref:DUF7662 domain-containing protein n=1 Tax=Micromonospora sp. NPDC050417 TaxID=3364280 RepID=UPI00378B4F1D
MSGKYHPLTAALSAASARGQQDVELDFDAIADLIAGLPPSAGLRQWWANTDHPQARAWRAAGYRVQQVHLDRRRVRFSRLPASAASRHDITPPQARSAAVAGPPAVVGSPVDVRVRLRWTDAGSVVLDGTGKPAFPRAAASHGLYRLIFSRPGTRIYIGESENLHRRLSNNYRNPGPSQQTSLRINALLREHLTAGGTVSLAVATAATVVVDEQERPLDLMFKAGRLLAESAALVAARMAGDAQIVNLG